jgi:hypothetical protein
MAETPIIDAAIRAGCRAFDTVVNIKSGCDHPSCECHKKALILAGLRAALPWPDGERMPLVGPLLCELYPEKFK